MDEEDQMTHRNRLGSLSVFILYVAVATVTPASAADSPDLADLFWMAGHWSGKTEETVMEEFWTAPAGGMMLGLHRDVRQTRPAFFEYLRIEERDSWVVYIASPKGKGATEFVLESLESQRAVFENSEHDFPQRIIYRREGDRLTARIEGVVGGKLEFTEWTWELVN